MTILNPRCNSYSGNFKSPLKPILPILSCYKSSIFLGRYIETIVQSLLQPTSAILNRRCCLQRLHILNLHCSLQRLSNLHCSLQYIFWIRAPSYRADSWAICRADSNFEPRVLAAKVKETPSWKYVCHEQHIIFQIFMHGFWNPRVDDSGYL